MEEYAQPVPFKDLKSGPKSETLLPNLLPEPENLVPKLRRPKPLNTTKHTLKEIEDANYNPIGPLYGTPNYVGPLKQPLKDPPIKPLRKTQG